MDGKVTSAPYLIDPTDFGLGDLSRNKERLQEYKKFPHEKFSEWKDIPLIEYKKSDKESFVILEYKGEIIYLVHLKIEHLKQRDLPHNATQAEVWRSKIHGNITRGITTYVFDLVLNREKIMVSDTAQTDRGKEFWEDILAWYAGKGYEVGVFDIDDPNVDWAPKDYHLWLRESIPKYWGKTLNHPEYFRFVIKK